MARGVKGTARHGTESGYFAHRNAGEKACRACLAAHTEQSGRWANLRARALTILRQRHLDEYHAIRAELLREAAS